MLRGEALICADGAVFSRTCSVEHFPQDAVVAFDRKDRCPHGWTEYDEAEGRFIVGAGRRSEFNKQVGDTDGQYRVTLEIDHMPSHSHENPSRGWQGSKEEVYALQATDMGEYGGPHARPTDSKGGGLAHENMPPYIALRWCKKE